MNSTLSSPDFSSTRAPRLRRSVALTTALLCGLSLAIACGDDDSDDNDGNSAGTGGRAGAAGSAGSPGTGGTAGTAGAGTGGTAGTAGTGGTGGVIDADGTVTVLSDDADGLKGPTTGAVRDDDLWVVNGQLSGLFGGAAPELPFSLVSLPLAGGEIGDTEIELPGDDFYPEGIAADSEGTLYVGSVTSGEILRIPAGETAPEDEPFVEAGVAQRGVIGLVVDEAKETLWFCDSSPTGNAPGGDLVGVDLDTGVEIVRHAMPDRGAGEQADAGAPAVDAGDAGDAGGAAAGAPTFCNDVIVASSGDIFATDSSGRIFRVADEDFDQENSAEVWLDDPAISVPGGFGANGIDQVGTNLIIASGTTLVAVNPVSNNPAASVRVLSLAEDGAAVELCGPDGLQTVPGSDDEIIVIENGSCTAARERVIKVSLDL